MVGHAFIIGGTGQIGRAVAARMLDKGWTVALGTRGLRTPPTELIERGAEIVVLDRSDAGKLSIGLGNGADLLIDTIGYDADHAAQLLEVQSSVSQIVTISSASVYADSQGRSLDKSQGLGFPELPVPITEAQATVPPGPATYSTRKIAMERTLLDGARVPAAVLRPCAIHGPCSQHPREWWFVKRLLDGRVSIPLAYGGESRLQTTATVNIAALIAAVAERRASGIFNAADPDAPSTAEIGRTAMQAIGRDAELIAVVEEDPPSVGVSPWAVPRRFILSDAESRAIGYTPIGSYAEAAASTIVWLASAEIGDWKAAFPVLAAYPWELFDYAGENAWLAGRA